MATHESYIQHLQAGIARWFSKDSEHLIAYYAKNGETYPVTRDEQDRCLERAYGYIQAYADFLSNQPKTPSATTVAKRCAALLVFWPCLMMVASDMPFPTNFSGLAIFFVVVGAYSLINKSPRRSCLRRIKTLRAEFEQKIIFRNAISSPQKRQNSFQYANWSAFGILCILAVFGRSIINVTGIDERHLFMIFLIIVLLFLGSSLLGDKLNAANIRQTGKWFRWPRRQ